jgi:O-acetyl-ADP-ribose deacetylase (regulator of RNase III)
MNDIVEERVDVIVNAANEYLSQGSGVCGAIFQAAGRYTICPLIFLISR